MGLKEGFSVNDILSYLALAYVSQTVAKLTAGLVPLKNPRTAHLLREWLASSSGVALAFGTRMDLLGEIGLDLSVEPLGFLITGLILGHGVQYATEFFMRGPWKQNAPKA